MSKKSMVSSECVNHSRDGVCSQEGDNVNCFLHHSWGPYMGTFHRQNLEG